MSSFLATYVLSLVSVGLLGSGMPETYEMLRLLKFVRKSVQKHNQDVTFPVEFATFITELKAAVDKYNAVVLHILMNLVFDY